MNPNLKDILKQSCSKSPMTYRDYIETVLYHPEFGYYSKKIQRVGRSSKTDFYTSESLGKIFARLVLNATQNLLKTNDLSAYHFIEIGAEPNAFLLSHLKNNPFKKHSIIRPGDSIKINNEPIILFANEWLDALPFHRLVFSGKQWCEKAVTLNPNGKLEETLLEKLSEPIQSIAERLPHKTIKGYQIDVSPETEMQIQSIINQEWTGLIILFDYGKTWHEITSEMPNGSARTYYQHKQGTDLLENPGEQDITFDICWDSLQTLFEKKENTQSRLQSQESFFVNYSQEIIKEILSQSQFTFSADKQTLLELLHPANMGQKFQTLHVLRK